MGLAVPKKANEDAAGRDAAVRIGNVAQAYAQAVRTLTMVEARARAMVRRATGRLARAQKAQQPRHGAPRRAGPRAAARVRRASGAGARRVGADMSVGRSVDDADADADAGHTRAPCRGRDAMSWCRVVGLTGGIATGKSTFARALRSHGIGAIVDADRIAHEVVAPGRRAYRAIVAAFGRSVLRPDGTVDRAALGALVFADPEQRRLLNRCTHPAILMAMAWEALRYVLCGHLVIVVEAPLLLETKALARLVSDVIVVHCDERVQLARLMERSGYTKAEARARIASQMPLAEKLRRATIAVPNDGTTADLERHAAAVAHQLRRKALRNRLLLLLLLTVVAALAMLMRRFVYATGTV